LGRRLTVLSGLQGDVDKCFTLGNGSILGASFDGGVSIWDPKSRDCVATFFETLECCVTDCVMVDNGFASSFKDGTVRLCDVRTQKSVATIKSDSYVSGCDATPDGSSLTFCSGGKLSIWNIKSGKVITGTFTGTSGRHYASQCRVVSDGLTIVTSWSRNNRNMVLWNTFLKEAS